MVIYTCLCHELQCTILLSARQLLRDSDMSLFHASRELAEAVAKVRFSQRPGEPLQARPAELGKMKIAMHSIAMGATITFKQLPKTSWIST